MNRLKIELQLQSDAIFGSGQSVPGLVDLDIIYDENGLPYFKSKTLKGKLREEVQNIAEKLSIISPELGAMRYVESLFGHEGASRVDGLKFSDCTLGDPIISSIEWAIQKGLFSSEEVLEALTDIKSFTSIDTDGIAKKGSLRQYRVVQKGITFVCDVEIHRELEEVEKEILAAGIRSLQHIGAMESKGKGKIEAALLWNETDVTDQLINSLAERVKSA